MTIDAVDFSRRQTPQPRLSAPRVPGRHSDRFWSADEDAIVREAYPNGGVNACIAKLPRRSQTGIYQRAKTLGLSVKARSTERKRHWSAEIDAKIVAAWPTLTGRGAVQRFADSIGAERWYVSQRACALGLTKAHRIKEPGWTAAEDALLARAPLHDPGRASAIFREHGFIRSATAITVRATRTGLSRRFKEALSARAAAKILGVDDKWITARCIDGRLEAEKRGTQRLVQQGGDTWSIEPAALRRFVLDHLEEIDIRKVDKFAFVHLLAATAAEAEQVRHG